MKDYVQIAVGLVVMGLFASVVAVLSRFTFGQVILIIGAVILFCAIMGVIAWCIGFGVLRFIARKVVKDEDRR